MTTGTIRNNTTGAELHGEQTRKTGTSFDFRIEGTRGENNFLNSDWTFTPDRVIPTEPGYYTLNKDGTAKSVLHFRLFKLSTDAEWSEVGGYGHGNTHQDILDLFAAHPTWTLTRLVPESANGATL